MSGLVNSFAFSFSSFKDFRDCPRKFWIAKILAWGGWERGCSRESRRAYVLTKMTFLFAHAGTIVHELADHFVRFRAARMSREKLGQAAASAFQLAIRQSHSQEWNREPKKVVNFFEHYYPGRARAATEKRAEEYAVRAAQGIATSTTIALADIPGSKIRTERLEKTIIARIPVWVKMDLEIERGTDYLIVDWKAGKPKIEDRLQLLLYTAFAVDGRGFNLGDVKTRIDYLGAGMVDDQLPELGEVQAFISGLPGAARSIRERLEGDGSIIRGPIENFPMTTDYKVCAACQFHEICYDQRELVSGMDTEK